MNHPCRDNAEQHNGGGTAHQLHTSLLERGEEAGADLQTNREDEENQTELLGKVADFGIDGHPEVAHSDAYKENPSDTERDASEFEFAEHNANRNHECNDQHRLGNTLTKKEVIQPLHN